MGKKQKKSKDTKTPVTSPVIGGFSVQHVSKKESKKKTEKQTKEPSINACSTSDNWNVEENVNQHQSYSSSTSKVNNETVKVNEGNDLVNQFSQNQITNQDIQDDKDTNQLNKTGNSETFDQRKSENVNDDDNFGYENKKAIQNQSRSRNIVDDNRRSSGFHGRNYRSKPDSLSNSENTNHSSKYGSTSKGSSFRRGEHKSTYEVQSEHNRGPNQNQWDNRSSQNYNENWSDRNKRQKSFESNTKHDNSYSRKEPEFKNRDRSSSSSRNEKRKEVKYDDWRNPKGSSNFDRDNRKNESFNKEDEQPSKVPHKSLKSYQFGKLKQVIRDQNFEIWLESKYKVQVTEIFGDLFEASSDYCLAHCVAEDFAMGSGIAVTFRRVFKGVDDLLNQRQRTGGLAVLQDKDRFIYYLVTKKFSHGKPTLETLYSSLKKLKTHMVENGKTKLAIPRIGCGLDLLEWNEVNLMIEYVFSDADVDIVVYNLNKQSEQGESPTVQRIRNCKVFHEPYDITKIASFTILIYLCSEDGTITDHMKKINEKFPIATLHKSEKKKKGEVYRCQIRNYIVYGFVVKNKENDLIDFQSFNKCLNTLNQLNKKDRYEYVALESFNDERDELMMEKIINLMRNGLRNVDVYICQPTQVDNP